MGRRPSDVIPQLVDIRWEGRQLFFKFPGYAEVKAHGYTEEWTAEERFRDACKTIWYRAESFGCTTFRDTR